MNSIKKLFSSQQNRSGGNGFVDVEAGLHPKLSNNKIEPINTDASVPTDNPDKLQPLPEIVFHSEESSDQDEVSGLEAFYSTLQPKGPRNSLADDLRHASGGQFHQALNRRQSIVASVMSEQLQDERNSTAEDDPLQQNCCNCCISVMNAAIKQVHPTESNDMEDVDFSLGISADESELAFHQMFEALDKNGSGKIDIQELKQLMQGLGLSCKNENVFKLFSRLDQDCDGIVSYEDFKTDLLNRWSTPKERKHLLKELFKMFDVIGDGVMQPKEVKVVMMSIGEKVSNQEIEEMFRQMNKHSKRKVISCEDFVAAMENHIESILPVSEDETLNSVQ